MLFPERRNVLDIEINGTVGEFEVKKDHVSSIAVKYILSNVGIETNGGMEQKIMNKLQPVREVFDLKELDFEQIMQRDIDDSRVSKDLIPYILNEKNSGLVKLFPPIVVVLVPRKEGKPLDYFPKVKPSLEKIEGQEDLNWQKLTAGEKFKEYFEFKQVKKGNDVDRHNNASLSINSEITELVIVDGQHRAMALIALYRNLNGKWPDGTTHHESFYEHWTKDKIKAYDLTNIRLPIIYCVFPSLNEEDYPEHTVPKACRSIFLALNKNARKVTTARNYLLEDNDLVPLLLRKTLSKIKNLKHSTNHNFRLWSVELDAQEDRSKLSSEVSITGVMPFYNMLETVLLYNRAATGLNAKRSNLHKVTDISKLVKRLNVEEELTEDEANNTKRKTFAADVAAKLETAFEKRVYPLIEFAFSTFLPFKIHLEHFHNFKVKVETENKLNHAILFEGQGLSSVFDSHLSYLTEMEKNGVASAEMKSSLELLKARKAGMDESLKEIKNARNKDLFGAWVDSQELLKVADSIYSNTFLTSAFQTALFMSYFSIIDKLKEVVTDDNLFEYFTEFIESLNETFQYDRRKPYKLFELLFGNVEKIDDSLRVFPTKFNFKKLLIPNEMKPDDWTLFRYFFLECWTTEHENVKGVIEADIKECRKDIMKKYVDREITDHLNEKRIDIKALTPEQHQDIVSKCATNLDKNLNACGTKHSGKGAGNLTKLYFEKIKEEDQAIDLNFDED